MRTKSHDLFIAALDCPYDIIALTETWLNDNFLNGEYFPSDYNVFRKDRQTGQTRGGGVLLAVRSNFTSREIKLPYHSFEIDQIGVCVDLFIQSFKMIHLYIFVSYIPPSSQNSLYESHIKNILEIANDKDENCYFVVVGDFNLPNINWKFSNDEKQMFPYNVVKDYEYNVIDSLSALNVYQINNISNSIGRILDLIFIDNCLEAQCNEPSYKMLENSIHHNAVEIVFNFSILNES